MYYNWRVMSKREEAIRRMNALGERGVPFFFMVDFGMEDPIVLTPGEASARGIFYHIGGATNAGSGAGNAPASRPFRFESRPVPYAEYARAFDAVRAEIDDGNTYLLNLTFPTPVDTDLTLGEIFHTRAAKYRVLHAGRFVCFSPEPFVRIAGGTISSRPMKGTIDAALPDAEAKLLADPKELAEHTTIVDLIRNDLNGVASGVTVERFRYVERVATHRGAILQVSSLITGRLPADHRDHLGTILFALLPAGSISGAPKRKTVEIILRTETAPRGFFTGVAGYFDGTALDSGVLIRYIEAADAGLRYRSGGGVTAMSDPRSEYDEMIAKVYVPAV